MSEATELLDKGAEIYKKAFDDGQQSIALNCKIKMLITPQKLTDAFKQRIFFEQQVQKANYEIGELNKRIERSDEREKNLILQYGDIRTVLAEILIPKRPTREQLISVVKRVSSIIGY